MQQVRWRPQVWNRCLLDAFLKNFVRFSGQILKTGFFHADPHPGNLAVARDQSLIFYDFGERMRESLFEIRFARTSISNLKE